MSEDRGDRDPPAIKFYDVFLAMLVNVKLPIPVAPAGAPPPPIVSAT